MNLTQRNDGQWRALKNDEIVKATRYLGSVCNAELQKLEHELRYGRDDNFELTTEKPLHLDHAYTTTVHSSQDLSRLTA